MQFYKKLILKFLRSKKKFDFSAKGKNIIVFAPHPDDETLGCGGTIAELASRGNNVNIVFLTDGTSSHTKFISRQELKSIRIKEAEKAAYEFGIKSENLHFLEITDGNLDKQYKKTVSLIAETLKNNKPDIIFVTSGKEFPDDHFFTNKSVLEAVSKSSISPDIYEYLIWYWHSWPFTLSLPEGKKNILSFILRSLKTFAGLQTLFLVNCCAYISVSQKKKINALNQHKSQIERLNGIIGWPVLGDVSKGEFLNFFLSENEFFIKR